MIKNINNNDSFIIRIDPDKSKDLETMAYEIEQRCKNISYLLNKNVSFTNHLIKKQFDELTERIIRYEDLKNSLSDSTVIPESIKRLGENHSVYWDLDFNTLEITVTDNGLDLGTSIKSAFKIPQEISDKMRDLSIKEQALYEVYGYLVSSYPSINTDAYRNFETMKEHVSKEFSDMQKDLVVKYAIPFMNEKNITTKFTWNLNFKTAEVDIKY